MSDVSCPRSVFSSESGEDLLGYLHVPEELVVVPVKLSLLGVTTSRK
jgi:hypothetical protein